MGNLPPFPMLSHQAITTMVQTEAGLSIVGLGVSLLALGYDHIIAKEPVRFHAHMTIILFIFDLLDAIVMCMSRTLMSDPRACDFQGIAITTLEVCIVLWNSFMALQVYRWIILKQDTLALRRQLHPALIFIVGYAVLNTAVVRLAVTPMNGDADLWCWIPKQARWARFWSVYVYVYPSMLFISYVFIQIYRRVVVTPKTGSSAPVLQAAARLRVGRKLMLYLLCFLATWTFPMINRSTQMARSGHTFPFLLFLHVLSKPAMGLLDSLVYGSVSAVLRLRLKLGHRHTHRKDPSFQSVDPVYLGEDGDEPFHNYGLDDDDQYYTDSFNGQQAAMLEEGEDCKFAGGGIVEEEEEEEEGRRGVGGRGGGGGGGGGGRGVLLPPPVTRPGGEDSRAHLLGNGAAAAAAASAAAAAAASAAASAAGGEREREEGGKEAATATTATPEKASIFVSTYNCGSLTPSELDLEARIPLWIPLGHDLYIIGVQELKGLHKLRQLVHAHLGGPSEYVMFGQEFGVVGGASFANQLGAIALIVYARTRDVRAGAFEMTAVPKAGGQQVLQGKNMLVFRAGNKGAVCLPFRLHQSTLVVAAAHLPADGSRRSKVEKRTATLQRVFRDADVAGELFDVHLQYQHTILLGDLNYRMIGTPEEVLIAITEAAAKARTLSSTTTADNNNGKAAPIAAPSVPNGAAVVGAVGGKQADAGGEEGAEVQTEPLSPFGSSSSSSGSSSSSESEGVLPGEENGAAAATAAAGVAKAAGADKGSADSLASAAASSASSSSAGQHPPVIPGTSWLDVRYQGLAAGAAPHPPSLEWDALVSARDELRSVQAAGLVLHGFKEHGISFPPSYRRVRGERGACGDYTDLTRLRYAYTTHLAPSGKALMPAALPPPSNGLDASASGGQQGEPPMGPPRLPASAPTATATAVSMLQQTQQEAEQQVVVQPALSSVSLVGSTVSNVSQVMAGEGNQPPQTVKIRVPSYTDRIWIHSLPLLDRALSFRAYELCDALWESDHRPVSAVLHLDLRPALDAHRALLRAYTPPPPPPRPTRRERSQNSGGSGVLPRTPTAIVRAKMSSFFNSTSSGPTAAATATQSRPGGTSAAAAAGGGAGAEGGRPTPSPATVTTAADEEEAVISGATGAPADEAAALEMITPSSASNSSARAATPRSGGPLSLFRRPSSSLPGTPRTSSTAAAGGWLQWLHPRAPPPPQQQQQQPQQVQGRLRPAPALQPPLEQEDNEPLLVFYVKLSNLLCQWELLAAPLLPPPPPPTPPPGAPPSFPHRSVSFHGAASSTATAAGVNGGAATAAAAAGAGAKPPPPSLKRAVSSVSPSHKRGSGHQLPRSPSTPAFPSGAALPTTPIAAPVPTHHPAPSVSFFAGAHAHITHSAPSSAHCSPARQAHFPPSSAFNSTSSGQGGAMTDVASGPNALPAVARLAVLFPLPSENRLETASRTLDYLDATICHEWRTWSRERKGLLKSTTHHPWEKAATAEGVTISAAVKVGGSLHMLLKLVDPNGQEIAQAVVPLPRPGHHGRRPSGGDATGAGAAAGAGLRRAQQQGVRAALTLHTVYRGTLTCDIEIVKVKIQKDPKRPSSGMLPPKATHAPPPPPQQQQQQASSPAISGPSTPHNMVQPSDSSGNGGEGALSRGLSLVRQKLAAAASMMYGGKTEQLPTTTTTAAIAAAPVEGGVAGAHGVTTGRRPHPRLAPLEVEDGIMVPPAVVVASASAQGDGGSGSGK